MLCEVARQVGVDRFLHISTDEVYGSIEEGSFTEADTLGPRSPYSASKAGSDLIALSHHTTHGLPVMVTRSSNNFGPYQFPEKVIPLFVTNLFDGLKVPLYGDGGNVRDWCYVIDNCQAVDLVLRSGTVGEIYNIGGGNEITNRELTYKLLALVGRDESYIQPVADRLGHDRRYSVTTEQGRVAGLAARARPRRGAGGHGGLVPGPSGVVGAAPGPGGDQAGRLSACASSSPEPAARSPRTSPADARRPATRSWRWGISGSTSPTVMPCSARSVRSAPKPSSTARPGRRWTPARATRNGPSRTTRWRCVGWPRGAAGPAATSCSCRPTTCSRARRPSPTSSGIRPARSASTGASKLAGELEAMGAGIGATIVRTSWVVGEHGQNMVKTILRLLAERPRCPSSTISGAIRPSPPTWRGWCAGWRWTADRASTTSPTKARSAGSSWPGRSPSAAGRDPSQVEPIATKDLHPPRPAPRPANSVLDNAVLRLSGLPLLPDFRETLPKVVRAIVDGA